MDKASNIKQLIAKGENTAVEFKNAGVSPKSLANEIVAFANTNGGTVLIGVEDDGQITGIKESDVSEEWAANIARNNLIPSIDLNIEKVDIEGKKVLCIEVSKGKDKPYQTLQNRFLIRVGSTNRVTTQHELLRLFQQSGVFHYDGVGVDGATIADLNFTKLDNYFDRYGIDFSHDTEKERLLKNTDILTDDGRPTIAGLLVFGTNPQRHIKQGYISFAHFQGKEISDVLIDRQDINGTLDHQIDTALSVIKNNIQRPSIIEGAKTVSTRFLYPDKVFRELLTNACIHRNYAIQGSQIRVFLFDDRIEFHSPGRLPNTVSIEKITSGVSYASNPILLKFMQNLHYIDKLGRGIPMIWKTAMDNGKKVEFEEVGEEFVVRLYL